MSAHCHDGHCHTAPAHASPRYRRVLWIALLLNALMFVVEISAGFASGSVSLLADAIDFFGDAANYAVSLAVLGMALAWRARAAFIKGLCMLAFGLFVISKALWAARTGTPPEALTMGMISLLALAVNVGVAALLYAWREGDANMRSVWLCSRNDAIGNVAVLLAALGVAGTRTAWPDLAVALGMGVLALTSAYSVLRQARGEMQGQATAPV
jgi:cation diffusion facilitator family transporter